MYADVIVDITQGKLDRVFQYLVPQGLEGTIQVGMGVEVPFGRGNRTVRGVVIGLTDRPSFDVDKIKPLSGLAEGAVPVEEKLIRLAAWIKEQYGSTMNAALKTVLPVRQKVQPKQKRSVRLLISREEAETLLGEYRRKRHTARARLLEELMANQILDYDMILRGLHVSGAVVKALGEQGVLSVEAEQVYRNPVSQEGKKATPPPLSPGQRQIVDEIVGQYRKKILSTNLIFGVTGSGKTEVYMGIIEAVVQNGEQAIVLIPEIALTYQTVQRFCRRFPGRVSIINSRLSQGEKYDQFQRARAGEIDVMIGPRSALFTPFSHLGCIIMDEEHEASYKSETVPRYHAREVAIERARMEGAMVVLGSATPSLESYYRATQGEYGLFSLKERVSGGALPTVHTVDLREELKNGNRSMLSGKLRALMDDRLGKREQIMLFINRRGYVGFVSCRSCGHTPKCIHCDVSLSAHNNGKLVCHYCGYSLPVFRACPVCGSPYIGGFKAGTQKIEQYLKQEYPTARILRMDADTTREKKGYETLLQQFANQEADILIGTQMIVKGHDFPNVTLVGILAADLSLFVGDFRSAERTFQLLAQAAGRAGRGSRAGEVVIQTYNPEHYSIVAAAAQDYEAFYEQETGYRELMQYPPRYQLLMIIMTSKEEEAVEQCSQNIRQQLSQLLPDTGQDGQMHQIIGPAAPAVAKIKDIYKRVLYVKAGQYSLLVWVKNRLEGQGLPEKVYMQFDFNPMSF